MIEKEKKITRKSKKSHKKMQNSPLKKIENN